MPKVKSNKYSRIHVTLSPDQKKVIRSDAQKRGLTMSSYLKIAALNESKRNCFTEV